MLPEVFLNVAKEWVEKKDECEAHERSAISRAYYAAYHSCRNALEVLGIPEIDHLPSHQRVIKALKTCDDKDLSSLGRKLADLKVMREAADYDIEFPLPIQNKQLAIRKAESILERCNEKTKSAVGT